MSLTNLYKLHIEEIIRRHTRAMSFHGFDRVVIYSGAPKLPFLDDNHYTFKVNPHFKHWVPLLEHAQCAVDFRVGEKPRLIYFQPEDYWHKPPADPEGYWTESFEIVLATSFDDVVTALAGNTDRCALIGEDASCLPELPRSQLNPSALINELHYHRAVKTEYEAECLRRANRRSAKGHLAAEAAFIAGKTELEIHHAYLAGAGVLEAELPYGNIVAVNAHSSVLHYHGADRETMSPSEIHSLVIDAGADYLGYASDITRSYAFRSGEYQDLLNALDTAQQTLVAEVAVGQSFVDLHWRAHYLIACILRDFDFVMMSPKDMVSEGITSMFFPCGLGHFIGLQVHDVGGYLMAPRERPRLRDPRAPYLRNARNIEAGQALTIEPGIYFMDMLLAELSRNKHSFKVNWDRIDAFRKYGGVRVEDCLLVHGDRIENQSRDAFSALSAEVGGESLKVGSLETTD